MSPARVSTLLQERPFEPFTIHTGNGSTVDVLMPELAFWAPGGRRLTVHTPREPRAMQQYDFQQHRIEVLLITKLALPVARGPRHGRAKKPAK